MEANRRSISNFDACEEIMFYCTYCIAVRSNGDRLPTIEGLPDIRITPVTVNKAKMCLVGIGGFLELDARVLHPVLHAFYYDFLV